MFGESQVCVPSGHSESRMAGRYTHLYPRLGDCWPHPPSGSVYFHFWYHHLNAPSHHKYLIPCPCSPVERQSQLCSLSHSRLCRLSPSPGLSAPSDLGRMVVGVILLLLVLSGDIETNPGPIGESSLVQ